MKKKTSDAWSMSHLSQQSSEPAHYIEYCIGFSDERFDLDRIHFAEKFGPWCCFHVRGLYTANVHRQTTDKLMLKSVISTVR